MAKNLYITTAIPYVNARPHIGNALDYLLADIWARYHRQHGQTVRFQVGTDEHGNKIATRAKAANQEPQAYVDSMYGNFKSVMGAVGADYTDFVRTTDLHHKAAVQYIWQQLQPHIYKGKYEGWYCVGHEAFFTDKEAADTNGICPDHQAPYERLSEENYYFKLSSFAEPIRDAILSRKFDILPAFRKKEVLNLLESGLQDVSISRPKKSLSWGVPVPDDPDHVMYVWIDALSNYLTVLGYPEDETWRDYWPADVQVVGKDIVRFHAAIWPAMLLALDIPLPKKLLVHGFVNIAGSKISKTVGNVVDPMELIDTYGRDAFRYFFSRHIPTLDDGDFTWERFETAYNTELANELGNLVSRIASMVNRYQAGVVGDELQAEHDSQLYHDAMHACKFDRAMDEVWLMVRSLNQYIEEVKPWEVAKSRADNPEAEGHLGEILGHCVGTLRQLAELLTPFLPDTAAAITASFAGGVVQKDLTVLFPKIYNHTPDPRAQSQASAVTSL
ncbi:MAG TPA: methionine--tRNA ligase [Candidatus Saccharimonadales bacterium]|jgi:methionyl-tRNA synthetase